MQCLVNIVFWRKHRFWSLNHNLWWDWSICQKWAKRMSKRMWWSQNAYDCFWAEWRLKYASPSTKPCVRGSNITLTEEFSFLERRTSLSLPNDGNKKGRYGSLVMVSLSQIKQNEDFQLSVKSCALCSSCLWEVYMSLYTPWIRWCFLCPGSLVLVMFGTSFLYWFKSLWSSDN